MHPLSTHLTCHTEHLDRLLRQWDGAKNRKIHNAKTKKTYSVGQNITLPPLNLNYSHTHKNVSKNEYIRYTIRLSRGILDFQVFPRHFKTSSWKSRHVSKHQIPIRVGIQDSSPLSGQGRQLPSRSGGKTNGST